jgi:hypothetical protein
VADAFDLAPLAATAFAMPQLLPQVSLLAHSGDTSGVSWSWATLTCVNNVAWLTYFALSGYWSALVPATSATVLGGTLSSMLSRRGTARLRPAAGVASWAAVLAASGFAGGRAGIGTLLTVAFAVQVSPSLWTAFRTDNPTGISRGTWLLALAELTCWAVFGLHESDPRLIALGITGIAASALMLARTMQASRRPPDGPGSASTERRSERSSS